LIISRLPVLKAFWPRRGDDKEKHGADFSGSVVAFGKVRNALSLERNLAHIVGCSSVPTSGARSVALVLASAVPFFTGSTPWLQAIACSMIIVHG